MKIKLLCLCTLSLLSSNSFGARGGVGVGNSHVVAGLNINQGIKTKEQAVELLKKLAAEINSGNSSRVNEYISQGGCEKEYSVFNDAEFFDFYPIEKDSVKRTSQVAMHLRIFLKNCKKVSSIKDDDVFDGPK
ncbi:MAG: hypothetical protein ACJAT2_003204 [Bacteriovoracaceae bacterium]|jgi:hypothetical protein